MRARLLSLPLLVLSLVVITASSPTSLGQGRGGFGKGGFGGFGNAGDPNAMFDRLAKGRGYFLINEMWMMKKPLQDYAQEKGITNGQITREQYIAFDQQVKAKFQGGSVNFKGGPGGGFGGPGGFPPGGFPQGGFAPGGFAPKDGGGAFGKPGGNPAEAMDQFAESEFKRRDLNLDNLLNTDEMPRNLKDELERWDISKDGALDLNEYKTYFRSRLGVGGEGNPAAPANPVTILIEEDLLDKRPEVFRAGKLPKNIPSWFTQLDSDKDGQVGLYEWRKGNKAMDDFRTWDRNDDGLITPDEAMRQAGIQGATIAQERPTGGNGNGEERKKGNGFSFPFSKKKSQ